MNGRAFLLVLIVLLVAGCSSVSQGGTTWRDSPLIDRDPYGYGFRDSYYNGSTSYHGTRGPSGRW